MKKSAQLLRTLLATGAALLLPLHFAAAQGPWVRQPFRATAGYFSMGYRALTLPGPTNVWGLFGENLYHGEYQYRIVFSPDDGKTWQNSSVAYIYNTPQGETKGQSVLDAYTTDGLHTWVLRYNYNLKAKELLATATGAENLVALPAPPEDARLIRLFTNDVGLIVGNPSKNATTWPIYRTTDGGGSWTAVASSPTPSADDTNQHLYLLGNSLWLATAKGQLIRTNDQGLTWQATTLPTIGKTISMAFNTVANGLLLTDKKELSATADGGKTWTAITPTGFLRHSGLVAVPGTTNTYLSFGKNNRDFSDSTSGSAISIDGGLTWRALEGKINHAGIVASSPERAWAREDNTPNLYRAGSLVLGSTSAQPQTAALAYPNPSNGQLQLAPTAHPRYLTLTDALGRRQRELTLLAGATTLDLSDCRPGVYMLTSTEQGVTQTQRLVLTAP